MNAMLFAAGLGTRLAPLTLTRPKALVEVAGVTLLDRAIWHLADAGVDRLVVNVHHFAPLMMQYIDAHRRHWPMQVFVSDERARLLDTAGGLAQAWTLLSGRGPVVVANADVICDMDLRQLYQAHLDAHHDATLLTSNRHSTRNLLFDDRGRLAGWHNDTSGETIQPRPAHIAYAEAFNGFHVVSEGLIERLLPPTPRGLVPAYLDLCQSADIARFPTPEGVRWFDVGTPQKLARAEQELSANDQ